MPASAPAGFLIVAHRSIVDPPSPGHADLARVAPTLLRLAGVGSGPGEPIREVAARFPRRDDEESALLEDGAALADARMPLTSDSLRALGLLSQSTRAPEARVDTAEARAERQD